MIDNYIFLFANKKKQEEALLFPGKARQDKIHENFDLNKLLYNVNRIWLKAISFMT